MSLSRPNVILAQVNGGDRPVNEKVAAATITPGDLLELTTAGLLTPVVTAGKPNGRMFALEVLYQPLATVSAMAATWATGDWVRFVYAQSGDLVQCRLATSQTVVIGDVLIASATGGCLAKTTVDATTLAGAIIGIAEEAVTTTGSTGYILVRIV